MPSVFIINTSSAYSNMFKDMGWKITTKPRLANLIQFTGGNDVSPSLYGQKAHPSSSCNLIRDQREALLFKAAVKHRIPMAGICRGGQFLHVMNGGEMYQHVDNHALAQGHKAVDVITGESFDVTSTHHQMIKADESRKDMLIVLCATESTWKEEMAGEHIHSDGILATMDRHAKDVEAVYYDSTQSFCFQPHPEYESDLCIELRDRYFGYLSSYLGVC